MNYKVTMWPGWRGAGGSRDTLESLTCCEMLMIAVTNQVMNASVQVVSGFCWGERVHSNSCVSSTLLQARWSHTCGSCPSRWWRTSCTTTGSRPPSLYPAQDDVRFFLDFMHLYVWTFAYFVCRSAAFKIKTGGCKLCTAPVRNCLRQTTTTSSESPAPRLSSLENLGPLMIFVFHSWLHWTKPNRRAKWREEKINGRELGNYRSCCQCRRCIWKRRAGSIFSTLFLWTDPSGPFLVIIPLRMSHQLSWAPQKHTGSFSLTNPQQCAAKTGFGQCSSHLLLETDLI